jgi:hypothetical protein
VKASTIVAVGFALLPWVSIGFLTPIAFISSPCCVDHGR